MKEKYKNILTRNNFVWDTKLQWRLRDDWYFINKKDWEFCVCSWDWEAHYFNSEYWVIWMLAIHWLILVYC